MNQSPNYSNIFDKYAENYSNYVIGYTVHRRYELIGRLLKGRVLELGSANGEILKYSNNHSSILLSDISSEMCKSIEKKYNQETQILDIDTFDLSPNKYDNIVALDVLCYSDNLEQSVKNIKRHLKSGGKFFVSTFNSKLKLLLFVRKSLQKLTNLKHVWFDEEIPIKNEYIDLKKFKKIISNEGLQIASTYYIAPIPFKIFHKLNIFLEKTPIKKFSTNIILEIIS